MAPQLIRGEAFDLRRRFMALLMELCNPARLQVFHEVGLRNPHGAPTQLHSTELFRSAINPLPLCAQSVGDFLWTEMSFQRRIWLRLGFRGSEEPCGQRCDSRRNAVERNRLYSTGDLIGRQSVVRMLRHSRFHSVGLVESHTPMPTSGDPPG